MKTSIFHITTGSGSTSEWSQIYGLEEHADALNIIGYSGMFEGVRMSRQEYFDKFVNNDTVSFAITQTKYDNGDFYEKFTVARTVVEPKVIRRTVKEIRIAHQALMDEAAATICGILEEKGILRMRPKDYIAYEYNLGKEDNRNVIEVWADGTVIVTEDWDLDDDDFDVDDEEECDVETEEAAMLDLEPEELYNLLECVENGNYEVLQFKTDGYKMP